MSNVQPAVDESQSASPSASSHEPSAPFGSAAFFEQLTVLDEDLIGKSITGSGAPANS